MQSHKHSSPKIIVHSKNEFGSDSEESRIQDDDSWSSNEFRRYMKSKKSKKSNYATDDDSIPSVELLKNLKKMKSSESRSSLKQKKVTNAKKATSTKKATASVNVSRSSESDEVYLKKHYVSTIKNIVGLLNRLIGKKCPSFPYRFKSTSDGDEMYNEEAIFANAKHNKNRCIYPSFNPYPIIVYAHAKGKPKEVASYLEFEFHKEKSEVHILASCTFSQHEKKNLSILLRYIPIFAMLAYKLEKVTSDTNELSGNLLVKKLGFTRTEKFFGTGTKYHETYLISDNIKAGNLKKEFLNTACSYENAKQETYSLRTKSAGTVTERKTMKDTRYKELPEPENLDKVHSKRKSLSEKQKNLRVSKRTSRNTTPRNTTQRSATQRSATQRSVTPRTIPTLVDQDIQMRLAATYAKYYDRLITFYEQYSKMFTHMPEKLYLLYNRGMSIYTDWKNLNAQPVPHYDHPNMMIVKINKAMDELKKKMDDLKNNSSARQTTPAPKAKTTSKRKRSGDGTSTTNKKQK